MQDMWITLSDVVLAWVSVAIADSHSQRAPRMNCEQDSQTENPPAGGFFYV